MSSHQVLNIGLILFPGYQWLDAAGCIDYLFNHSREALAPYFSHSNPGVVAKAPSMKWHYISSDRSLVHATSGPPQLPTATYDDCPGLDLLVVPGPDPTFPPPPGFVEFMQKRYADPELKALLMVCTGSIMVAHSGILDGRQVCSNKFILKEMATAGTLNRKVKWIGDRRWIVDGKLWSAGGVTCGVDLAAEYGRVHFDKEVGQTAMHISEYKPNPDKPDFFAYITVGVDL
ncbi:Isonitrile hydratase [Psilocybe cubensis]|uniref:Isonitrile hydratase n=2 Tax=Psilocybe cubensis TaxID=181762 RepID=A0ACB8GVV3_PSICU|nr:Isonitrile hydratase [Psilocybe cubensis]KAH9479868.1 Isonitrile hydratase [Psilocybe cubensis]